MPILPLPPLVLVVATLCSRVSSLPFHLVVLTETFEQIFTPYETCYKSIYY